MSQPLYSIPPFVVPFGASQNITGATVLEPFRDVKAYLTNTYVLRNDSGTVDATMLVEFSWDGESTASNLTQTIDCPAGKSTSYTWGVPGEDSPLYARLTATPDSGTIPVRWARRGLHR